MTTPVALTEVVELIQLDALATLREGGLGEVDRARLEELAAKLRDDVVLRDVVMARDYWRGRAEAAEALAARPWVPLPPATVRIGGHDVGWASAVRYPDAGHTERLSGGMGMRSGVVELRGAWHVQTESRPGLTTALAEIDPAQPSETSTQASHAPWFLRSKTWWLTGAAVWLFVMAAAWPPSCL